MADPNLREVSISTGYGRKIAIVYQTWDYSVYYTEKVYAITDADIAASRQKLHLLAMGAVYRDILADIPRLSQLIETSVATDMRMATSERAKLSGLKTEAEQGIEQVLHALQSEEPSK